MTAVSSLAGTRAWHSNSVASSSLSLSLSLSINLPLSHPWSLSLSSSSTLSHPLSHSLSIIPSLCLSIFPSHSLILCHSLSASDALPCPPRCGERVTFIGSERVRQDGGRREAVLQGAAAHTARGGWSRVEREVGWGGEGGRQGPSRTGLADERRTGAAAGSDFTDRLVARPPWPRDPYLHGPARERERERARWRVTPHTGREREREHWRVTPHTGRGARLDL